MLAETLGLGVLIMAGMATAGETMASDTVFKAIDMVNVDLGAKGVEPSPFILWHDWQSNNFGVWIMTLDGGNGSQKGNRLSLTLPELNTPVDILWTKSFSNLSNNKGIEPVPWIVFRDYKLYTFPVTFASDGTPRAGTPSYLSPSVNTATYGYAVCSAELPGTEFDDGRDRLFIGSDKGYIIVLAQTFVGGIRVVDIFSISSGPIVDLQPIPQYGYIALGAFADNVIKGIHYFSGAKDEPMSGSYGIVFTLSDTRLITPLNFDAFGSQDAPVPDSQTAVNLIIANGTSDLGLAKITSHQNGHESLYVVVDSHPETIKSVVAGSLLYLPVDESAVRFDPDYSQDTGYSGCEVDITDDVGDVCGYVCGDANGSGAVNALDITFLINYLYKGGAAPNPMEAGDANGSGIINALDITYLINYLYKGGAAPNCP
jgi:hypothetical protein